MSRTESGSGSGSGSEEGSWNGAVLVRVEDITMDDGTTIDPAGCGMSYNTAARLAYTLPFFPRGYRMSKGRYFVIRTNGSGHMARISGRSMVLLPTHIPVPVVVFNDHMAMMCFRPDAGNPATMKERSDAEVVSKMREMDDSVSNAVDEDADAMLGLNPMSLYAGIHYQSLVNTIKNPATVEAALLGQDNGPLEDFTMPLVASDPVEAWKMVHAADPDFIRLVAVKALDLVLPDIPMPKVENEYLTEIYLVLDRQAKAARAMLSQLIQDGDVDDEVFRTVIRTLGRMTMRSVGRAWLSGSAQQLHASTVLVGCGERMCQLGLAKRVLGHDMVMSLAMPDDKQDESAF